METNFLPNCSLVIRLQSLEIVAIRLFKWVILVTLKWPYFFLETDLVLRNADRIEYLSKGDHIYEKCDRVTQPENSKFLAKCVEKIGSDCGEQILDKLFTDEGSVTGQCCQKLVKMGEKCHINMAKTLIRTPAMRDIDAVKFLGKNKKIFDDCKDME